MSPGDPASAHGPGRLSAGLARWIVRGRYLIVLGWIGIALFVSTQLPTLEQANTGSLGDLVANDAEAIETEVRSVELFGFPVLSRTVVVQTSEDGLDQDAVARVYRRAAQLNLGELVGLRGIAFALATTDDVLANLTGERSEGALTYMFFPPEIGPVGRTGLAERFIDRVVVAPGDGEVGLTGAVPARGEQIREIAEALPLVELATIIVVTLAMALHFRSLGAPAANILCVGLAYLISLRLLGGAGEAVGISVPEEVEPVMVALLFGIVTDYAIFYISRFRRHLEGGTDPLAAAERTTAELTPIVVTAGLSVAGASAALIVARLGFFQAFGPGLALAVLVSLAVVTTFIPAVIAILGRLVFWPRRFGSVARTPNIAWGALAIGFSRFSRWRSRLLELPTRRPIVVAIVTVLPLVALSLALGKLEVGNTLISGLPKDSPTKAAFRQAAEVFPPGAISPLMILVEGENVTARSGELRQLGIELGKRQGFAEVIGPGRVDAVDRALQVGATLSSTGDAARYLVVLDVNPLSARGIELASKLSDDLDRILVEAGLDDAVANLAGDTAISEETVRKTDEDLRRIVPAAALVVFLILAVFLRALVAPLYLVLASLLALAASLGLTVIVFQGLLGQGELTFYVPFAGTVLLVALGSDYNVYLVGRVWDEARSQPLRQAVAVAGARATSTITVAGLVLASSFALLALVPIGAFRELAFVLVAGLLIDAFIVRGFLAPALISLFGDVSSWPGRRLRRHPDPIGSGAGLPPERISG